MISNASLLNARRTVVEIAPFIVIMIASLILWWAPNNLNKGFIIVGDSSVPLSNYIVKQNLDNAIYAWTNNGLGSPNIGGGVSFVYYELISILSYVGTPLWITNRIIWVLPSLVSGLSTYYLAATFVKGRFCRIGCTTASLFAILTPAQDFQGPNLSLGFAAVPLLLALFIRGMNGKRSRIGYVSLTALSSVIVAVSPFALVIATGILLIYIIYYLIRHFEISAYKFVLYTLGLTILVNFFWLYPTISSFISNNNLLSNIYGQSGQTGGIAIFQSYASASGLIYAGRLILDIHNGLSNYYQDSPIITLFSLFLPILAYLTLLQRKTWVYFLTVTSLLLTILATGLHYPSFAPIFRWLWASFLPIQIVNSPLYYEYVLTFFYAVLIGSTVQIILMSLDSSMRNKHNVVSRVLYSSFKLVAVILVLTIVLVSGGMTLNLLGNSNYTINYARTVPPMQIPSSYENLLNYFLGLHSNEFRLLVLPFQAYVVYTWSQYQDQLIAGGITPNFSPLPVIGVNSQLTPVLKDLLSNLSAGATGQAFNTMENLSIEYVLISKDLESNNWANVYENYSLSPSSLIELFGSAENLFVPIMENAEFNLYVLNSTSIPQILSAGTISTESSYLTGFDGESAYVEVTRPSFSLNNTGSIFAWINPRLYSSGGSLAVNPTIIDFGSNQVWRLDIDGARGTLEFWKVTDRPIRSNYSIQKNIWYFVGVVANQSSISLYVNGQAVSTQPSNISSTSSTNGLPLYIGHDGTSSFFDGYIRNLQIYSNYLSPSQVMSLYQSGADGSSMKGIVGWWPLNETGQTALDLVGGSTGIRYGNVTNGQITQTQLHSIPIGNIVTLPTEYVFSANSTSPFEIILNEKFTKNWVSYANGALLPSISSGGYQNVWFVNQSGNYKIKLVYTPQTVTSNSFVVSEFALGLAVLTVVSPMLSQFLRSKSIPKRL